MTTDQTTHPCPTWCTGGCTWETETDTRNPIRLHGLGGVEATIGTGYRAFEVGTCAEERWLTGGFDLTPLKVCVNADGAELTPDEARQAAAALLNAADAIDTVTGTRSGGS